MATTIVNPTSNDNSGNNFALLLGIIIFIIFALIFFIYVLPLLTKATSSDIQVNVPKDINVSVQEGE